MQANGKGNIDGIDVVLCEQLVVGAVGAGDVVGLGLGLGFGERASGNGDDGDGGVGAGGVEETLYQDGFVSRVGWLNG